jgi:CubicO group peptidase (beta-lactamase class C family)
MIVETVTKKSVNELMKEHVFQPLGMTRTSMVWERRFEDDYANGYDEKGESRGPERRLNGDASGSMQTTLRDYARFVEAVLSGAYLDGESRELILSPQIQIMSKHEVPSLSTETTAENRAIHLSYGIGWGSIRPVTVKLSSKKDMMRMAAGVTTLYVSTDPRLARSS